jgi:hypothetical protein
MSIKNEIDRKGNLSKQIKQNLQEKFTILQMYFLQLAEVRYFKEKPWRKHWYIRYILTFNPPPFSTLNILQP